MKSVRSLIRFRRFEPDSRKRRLTRAADIEDLRKIAKRRLPRGVFDYLEGGAEAEITAARNQREFGRLGFVPRVLRNMQDVDTSVEMFGVRWSIPLVLAPTGFTRIFDPQGELAVARAAAKAGIPYTLSTLGTRSIEEVAAVSEGEKWFQVYVWRDRGLVVDMLARAEEAGYSTIVITVDTAVLGRRERDVRRGFSLPPKIGLDTIWDGIVHPRWTWGLIRGKPIRFANVRNEAVGDGSDPISLAHYINTQFDPSLSWDDISWFRDTWPGNIVIKGIQSVADAELAAASGVDAIALSNHGGRQLDGAPAAIELVSPVAQALGGEIPILCDGGVRRGSDIVKATAMGATACMAGRAYLYGLGAGGELGVDHALSLIADGVRRTMALAGYSSIGDLHPGMLQKFDG